MAARAGPPVLAALVARSNRLGADRAVCNWGGGNTSSKTVLPDHQLEDFYRQRTTLGVSILPADVAAAVAYFASEVRSGKSTGNILNVDGGVAAAYPR